MPVRANQTKQHFVRPPSENKQTRPVLSCLRNAQQRPASVSCRPLTQSYYSLPHPSPRSGPHLPAHPNPTFLNTLLQSLVSLQLASAWHTRKHHTHLRRHSCRQSKHRPQNQASPWRREASCNVRVIQAIASHVGGLPRLLPHWRTGSRPRASLRRPPHPCLAPDANVSGCAHASACTLPVGACSKQGPSIRRCPLCSGHEGQAVLVGVLLQLCRAHWRQTARKLLQHQPALLPLGLSIRLVAGLLDPETTRGNTGKGSVKAGQQAPSTYPAYKTLQLLGYHPSVVIASTHTASSLPHPFPCPPAIPLPAPELTVQQG